MRTAKTALFVVSALFLAFLLLGGSAAAPGARAQTSGSLPSQVAVPDSAKPVLRTRAGFARQAGVEVGKMTVAAWGEKKEGKRSAEPMPPVSSKEAAEEDSFVFRFSGGWPQEAKSALEQAGALWAGRLETKVPLVIEATWEEQGGQALANAGPTVYVSGRKISSLGGEVASERAYYPLSLANALAGVDVNTSEPEIEMTVNSGVDWHYGLGDVPDGTRSLFTVALHELVHGMGFLGTMKVERGIGSWGLEGVEARAVPTVYDLYARDKSFGEAGQAGALLNVCEYPNESSGLAQALTSGSFEGGGSDASGLYFSMPSAGRPGAQGGEAVALYAPSGWLDGTSYIHHNADMGTLMIPYLPTGRTVSDPELTTEMLGRLGWPLAQGEDE